MLRRSWRHCPSWLLALVLALLGAPVRAAAASLQEVQDFGDNPGNTRMFLYVPDRLAPSPPVLVALHYCGGSASAYFTGTGYRSLADQYGFLVIYPEATSSGSCFDVHSDATLKHDGGGDSASIASMVRHVLATYGANRSRVYVTGTSSGAMMTNVLLGAYPDLFRAGAAFAGVPYGCFAGTGEWNSACAQGQVTKSAQAWGDLARSGYPGYAGPRPRVQLWHGDQDETLSFHNLAEAIKQWTNVLGVSETPTSTERDAPETGFVRTRYADSAGAIRVEAVVETGMPHNLSVPAAEVARFFGLDAADDPVAAGSGVDAGVALAAAPSGVGTSAASPEMTRGVDIYVSPNGGGTGSSAASPATLGSANSKVRAGDTVWLKGGVYAVGIAPASSGAADAWITYKAVPGELPIIDNAGTGIGLSSAEYIAVDGVASRNNQYMGFSNKYTDMCSAGPVNNGRLRFKNVIAEGNGISGIAFFCASEILIENAIVAHNGLGSSWSSGVNLYGAVGGPTQNVVRSVVSFENIDISDAKSDGSGFIMDNGSDGVLFQNCIGFRNGGSCFRVTKSKNPQFINNTCWDDSQYDQYGDEILFSDATSRGGALVRNNLLVPHAGKQALGNAQGVVAEATVTSPNDLASTAGALDFRLVAGAADAIDRGLASGAPESDIGFDPACIKQGAGSFPRCGSSNGCDAKIGWFQYRIDYDYIAAHGGIAACFRPGLRAGNPDVGAYEYAVAAGMVSGADAGASADAGVAVDAGSDDLVDSGCDCRTAPGGRGRYDLSMAWVALSLLFAHVRRRRAANR